MAEPGSGAGQRLGIYVHVPFCARRCDYCAFATWAGLNHLARPYVDACLTELRRAYDGGLGPAATVFFGGGTPSQLPGSELARLLDGIPREEGAEVTVECNPEDVTVGLLGTYAAAGVTRISLGVQSLASHVLASLGRRHNPETVPRAVGAIGEVGFDSFSVDLIYGARDETDDDWAATLRGVLGLDPPPPHLSAYALQAEPGTALWRDPDRHPDDDAQARRYETADRMLEEAGLGWYEISNWSRPGHECRHNQNYWRQGEYLGVGCAAHSHLGGRRFWNIRSPERYMAAIASNRSAVASAERLDSDHCLLESLELAVRTREGVDADALPDDEMLAGLVARDRDRAVLTLRGRLLANEVACRLRAPAGAARHDTGQSHPQPVRAGAR
ncbi:MAG: radical SAM family heme chaperone HemW [Acidimicrobiales bacterium]